MCFFAGSGEMVKYLIISFKSGLFFVSVGTNRLNKSYVENLLLFFIFAIMGNSIFISNPDKKLSDFGRAGGFSDKVSISRVPNILKSVSLWSMGVILTLFIGILSLEGTVASTVDGVTVKTAKFLFSGSVPVVGKLLGDSVDVILGSTLIIKDAVGFVGVAVLFGLALTPIIKIIVVTAIYAGLSAIIEPFSDKRICKCLNDTADAGKMLLGIVVCVTVMVIIGTVMLLKITNFTSMHG